MTKFRKLGRPTGHRMSMLRTMVSQLVKHERIETTVAKAKEVRRLADNMVQLGKEGSLSAARRAAAFVRGDDVLHKLFTELAYRYKDYPKLVILWTVLFVIVSFLPDLSYSGEVVDKHDLDFHAGNVPCPKKWIMEPYFEMFDSLLDSHFQDFKERTLYPCSCKPLRDTETTKLKLSGLERRLVGEGSHRRLSLSVRINVNPSARPCEVIIIERLPSGIFADPFELRHLVQRGVFNDVAVLGDTDLELPTVRSNRTVVEIHMDVGPNSFSRHKDGQEINLHIPLHVRYPPLHESGYTKVVFGDPDVFARCSIDGRPIDETCLSTVTRDNAESTLSSVAWEVPSGIEMHAGVVSSVTFLSATVSAMIIILASIFHSDAKSCKQS